MHLGPKLISRDDPPLIMAEVGVNHDGDVGKALKLVEAAAAATCDAVKFQLFRADLLLSREAALVDYQKTSAASADDLLKNLELSPEQMQPLIQRAHELGMAAMVTPFSPELVTACAGMGADAIKLASPDLVNKPLLQAAATTGLPLIVSTGAADLAEVERTVGWLYKMSAAERAILLHCVSAYPTPAENAALAAITVLRQRFVETPVGYSDHTIETFTAALAVVTGACILEKHLTLDRAAKGPDHAASLEPDQMAEYCALARIGYAMRGAYLKQPQALELQTRQQTRQSLAARRVLRAGETLAADVLTVKRPGTGIPAADLESVIGQVLTRDVEENSILHWEDIGRDSQGAR